MVIESCISNIPTCCSGETVHTFHVLSYNPFSLLRTPWLWVKQTRRRWSSSARSSTRPWERAGLPKSTGWPTMWPKTTAPRVAETPHRPGVRGQEDTEGVCECVGGKRRAEETGWRPPWFKEGNLAEYPKHEQIHPTYCPYRGNLLSKTVQLACTLLPVSLLALHHSGMVPPENPNSRSRDISVESWWVKSLQVLHRRSSWRSTQPKEGTWSTHSAHTKNELSYRRGPAEEFMCWSGWISSGRLETPLVWTLKGAVVWSHPWTFLSTAEIADGCGKGGIERTNSSDPHVLKQCAQHPQEVHLNCLAPAVSKSASKLREDCIFYEFSFSVAI